jgi:hypothetical protein
MLKKHTLANTVYSIKDKQQIAETEKYKYLGVWINKWGNTAIENQTAVWKFLQ